MKPDRVPAHDIATEIRSLGNHQRTVVHPPERFTSLTNSNTTLCQAVASAGGVNIARNNLPATTEGDGSHDSGTKNGQTPEPIFVHWSCTTATAPKPSPVRTVVVDVEASNNVAPPSLVTITPPHRPSLPLPHWDQKRRELWVDGVLVKKFRQPSPNQETILAAFQEEDWPSSIDDPLPPDTDINPKHRLHFTIHNLNRGHGNLMIRFKGDGTGQGVTWRWLPVKGSKKKQ